MTSQVMLIGLDGATFSVLDPLMQDGIMPFLQSFMASGMRADLRSVIPALTPPAWTSMVTGRSPGNHGIFDFFCKESSDSHHIRLTTSRDVRAETIWSIVNRHGMRATVLNFPLMFPPPKVNGYVVPGWMPWKQLRLGCSPAHLYDRLKARPGFNARELGMDTNLEAKALEGCEPEEYEAWIDLHIRREQQWFQVLEDLMHEDRCELTAVLFDGVDRIQHLCWRFLDPTYAGNITEPWEQRVRARCLEYFRQLDHLLAECVRLAGPEATVIMTSDHGFGPQQRTFFVNAWLAQHGYLTWADSEGQNGHADAGLGIDQIARHAYQLNWEQTQAYAPMPSSNGIHIVRKTQAHPQGVPEAQYEAFRDQLIEKLRGLTDPTSGVPVVSHIWRREEAFDGAYMELAPDLTLELEDGGLVSILASNALVRPRPEPSGTHRPKGIIIARGPHVRQGLQLSSLPILDVAPLILYSLDLPIPTDMEGRVPTEALKSELLQARSMRTAAPSDTTAAESSEDQPESSMDEESELAIIQRLRALGYME
jgi:predicted AlkP superfamily phosphohydrolase/phosphomutase